MPPQDANPTPSFGGFGFRRSTDMVRGILERTRGDLTMALRQRSLEERLAAFQSSVAEAGQPSG